MSKLPHTMSPDEIVTEMGELRESLNLTTQRMLDLSKALYTQMRRSASSSATPVYIAYSNAWMRFAGAMTQGLKRTVSTDRVLERYRQAEADKAEKARQMEAREARKREVVRGATGSEAARKAAFGDLIELYGEEMVRDASR